MEKVIIAVDAGGTKTKVCAINKDKEIVYEVTGGSGSPAVVKEEAFINMSNLIENVIDHVKEQYEVSFIQLGISGLGAWKDLSKVKQDYFDKFKVETPMESDAILGLYSIIEDKSDEGILVLSGTGSVCAGINNDKTMTIGGFGQLLTETGSSYASVKMLVKNTILHYEETLTYTELGKSFMKEIGATSLTDFRIFMYNQNKSQIASYARFISDQALKGNEEAIEILKIDGRDLAHSVILLHKHLNLSEKTLLGFRGSFIQNAPFVKEELVKTVNEAGYFPTVVEGNTDPVYGAYYMAKKKGKI